MLTAVLTDLGRFDILDRPEPPPPGPGEVKIRVERIGICGSDISAYYGRHPYIHCPIILGHEFSGVISEVGDGVDGLKPGVRCCIVPHLKCGKCPACLEGRYNHCGELKVMGAQADGAFTEYINVPSEMTIPIPDEVSMEQAALVEPGAVGYHAAQRANLSTSDTVLIMGAGPIGIFTMQSVRALGAKMVISVDKDTDRLALATRLGADGVIDLASETLDDGLSRPVSGAANVDIFVDCVGFGGEALNEIIRAARRGARVVVAGVLEAGCTVPLLPDFVEHELTLIGSTMYVPQDFRSVLELMAQGKVRTDGMISHSWKLSEVKSLYEMIDSRSEKFFKIVLSVE